MKEPGRMNFRPITIYEGGIFESCWGAGGVEYRTFFRLQENAAYYRLVSEVSEVWLGEDSDKLGFYMGDEEIKITEEEYWDLVNVYESLPQKELEWHTLDGFCAAQAY